MGNDAGVQLLNRLRIRHPDLVGFQYPADCINGVHHIQWRFDDETSLIQPIPFLQEHIFFMKAYEQECAIADNVLADAMISRIDIFQQYYHKLWVDFYSNFITQYRDKAVIR